MWVYRPGRHSAYFDDVLSSQKMILYWDGFSEDLSSYKTITDFRKVVENERETDNRTTISNLSCQLDYFCNRMKPGDYVLIPAQHSHYYALARISGDYEFDRNAKEFPHCRNILIVEKKIRREFFPQDIQYSLGAFRTVFHAKHENEIITILRKHGIVLSSGGQM